MGSESNSPNAWLPISPERRSEGMSIINAASSMTASGVLLSKFKDQKIDEDTLNFFSKSQGITDPDEVSGRHWSNIKRSALSQFLPEMQRSRASKNLASMSNKEVNYLFQSESYNDFISRKNKIDRVASASATFAENPLSVFSAAVAISMTEPWNIASMPIALVKASSVASSAFRLGALGGTIAAGEELILRDDDPNRTIGISASSVALATVLNGAIGTYLSRTRAVQQAQMAQIQKSIKSIDREGNVIIDLENDMLEGASATINLNLIDNAREMNLALKEIPGVGPKTAQRILDTRNSRPEARFASLDDIIDDSMDSNTKNQLKKIIDSGKFHASSSTNLSDDAIVGAYGIEKIAGVTAPVVRLMNSPFPEIRRAAKELLDTPFLTTDNLKNIPSPVALEQAMSAKSGILRSNMIDDLELPYYAYLNPEGKGSDFTRGRGGRMFRQAGQLVKNLATGNVDQLKNSPTGIPGKMTFDQFKLAALEHHTGARVSTDINVKNAAKGIQKFFKSEEVDVKKFLTLLNKNKKAGKKLKANWADNIKYTHRIYNKKVIAENPEAFENFLVAQLVKKHGSVRNVETELQAGIVEIRTTFRNTIDKLAKSPEERIELEKVFTPNEKSAAMNRMWTFIDEADLYRTDFVVKDIESIANSYTSSMLADVAFYKKYGTLKPKEVADSIKSKIKSRINVSGKDKQKLEEGIDLLEAMLHRVRGTYLDPSSPIPGGTTQNTMDLLKKYNNLRLGAFFGIKSAPDVGRSIMFLGLGRAYGPLFKAHFLRNREVLSMYNRSSRELRSIMVGNEINSSSLLSSLTDTKINSFSANKITDAANKNNNAMFTLNGLNSWNELMKKNAGIGVLDQIVESAKLSRKGKLPQKQSANLNKLGLSKKELEDFLVEFEKHGESYQGINLLNFENWSKSALDRSGPLGLSLADRVQLAIKKEVDTIIVTPGIGDVPLIMENSWVSLFTQYKSFPIAAVVRQTLPLAQNLNSNAFAGLLVSVSAAFVAKQFVNYAKGNEVREDSWGDTLWESLEDTGTLSTIGEFSNYAQMISSGNPMTIGPLGTLPQDIFKVQAGLANEEGMSPYEERAASRLLPYAGLLEILNALPKAAVQSVSSQEN